MVGTDLALGNGAEADALHRAVGTDGLEILLHLLRRGAGVPVHAQADGFRHRLGTDSRLAVTVVGVEREAHHQILMASLAVALEGVEHLDLVHLQKEDMPLGLGCTGDQRGIGHVAVNLLNDQAFRTLRLVLVGTLGVHLLLPLGLALLVDGVALTDVGHDVVDGLVDATLTRARLCYQAVHQRCLVLHIVCVLEGGLIEVCAQRREDTAGHSGLIRAWHLGGEQTDELGQMLAELRRLRSVEVEVVRLRSVVLGVILGDTLTLQRIEYDGQRTGHAFVVALQGAADLGALFLQRETVVAGDYLVEPVEVVAADVAQGVGKLVGLRIAVADGRLKAVIVQLPVLADDLLKRVAVILFGESGERFTLCAAFPS